MAAMPGGRHCCRSIPCATTLDGPPGLRVGDLACDVCVMCWPASGDGCGPDRSVTPLPSEITTRRRAAGRRRAPASGPNCVRASARPRRSVHASIPDRQHPCALPRSVPTATFLHGLNRRSGQCSPPRCDAREFGCHSAVAAAATSVVRWVAVKRPAALPPPPVPRSAQGRRRRARSHRRGRASRAADVRRPPRRSVQSFRGRGAGSCRGNGTLSGVWVLLAMLFIAASSFVKQGRATSCPFPESTASGGSCLAWISPGPRPRPWRHPSASGRAASPSVTYRPCSLRSTVGAMETLP